MHQLYNICVNSKTRVGKYIRVKFHKFNYIFSNDLFNKRLKMDVFKIIMAE